MTTKGKLYTAGSLNFIYGMAGQMKAKSIAAVLHRSVKSIRRKAEKLGISLKVVR